MRFERSNLSHKKVDKVLDSSKFDIPEFDSKLLGKSNVEGVVDSLTIADISDSVSKYGLFSGIIKNVENTPQNVDKVVWDKFVDNVLVPSLESSMNMLKEHIRTEVAKDLKSMNPSLK